MTFGWSTLVTVAVFFQTVASFTPFGLGVLLLIPGYLTTPPPKQFALQMATFTIVAAAIALTVYMMCMNDATWKASVGTNVLSAFLASYYVAAGISYVVVVTGLTAVSAFDPVGIFSCPSPLSLKTPLQLTLLLLWAFLAVSGASVQNARDRLMSWGGSHNDKTGGGTIDSDTAKLLP